MLTQHADGSGQVDLIVVGGSGDLARIHGYLQFTWTDNNNLAVEGQYHGFLIR